VARLREENRRLQQQNTQLRETQELLREGRDLAMSEVARLEHRPDVETLWARSYDNFGRENVVKLSQLIARYLENKPGEIDASRIYSSVQSCYRDFQRGFSDNPEHYYLDVRMLLSTCAASTWFTTNQLSRIRIWLAESGWD
jgi:hypothetical protein